MQTFQLLCAEYLSVKRRFLDSTDKKRQYAEMLSEPDPTPDVFQRFEQYERELWSSYIAMTNAAGMLLDYVSSCAMELTRTKGFMCFFKGSDYIEDVPDPTFSFGFEFMVIPDVDALSEKYPDLSKTCDQIKYGSASINGLKRELDKWGIPHSEIMLLGEISDYSFMHKGFDKLLLLLKREGLALIEEFRSSPMG